MSLSRPNFSDQVKEILTKCSQAESIEALCTIAERYAKEFNLANMTRLPNDKTMENQLVSLNQTVQEAFIRKTNEIIETRNKFIAKKYDEWSDVDRKFSDLSKL